MYKASAPLLTGAEALYMGSENRTAELENGSVLALAVVFRCYQVIALAIWCSGDFLKRTVVKKEVLQLQAELPLAIQVLLAFHGLKV